MKVIAKVLIVLVLAALPAVCGSFTVNSVNSPTDWYGMVWAAPGGTIVGYLPGSVFVSSGGITLLSSTPDIYHGTDTWIFNFATVVTVTVTDLAVDGDQFQVFLNGSSVAALTTSVPLNDGTSCGDDPVTCFLSPKMSHGSITLAAGSYTMTMKNFQTAFQYPFGAGAFRIDAGSVPILGGGGVPEPATLGLMGMGLGGLLLGWRARRR